MSSLCADSQELINVIYELRSVVMSPMPLYAPTSSPPPPTRVSNNGTSFQLPQASLKLDKQTNDKGEIRIFTFLFQCIRLLIVVQ